MQSSLFCDNQARTIQLEDGELIYIPNWLSPKLANLYQRQLRRYCQWEQSTIFLAGRTVQIPRLNAWYGDPATDYQYSGRRFVPLNWFRALGALRQHLRRQLHVQGFDFEPNSALLNCYRDGNDSVSWHADDEKELGPAPLIASISLGATRRFLLKHRRGQQRYRIDLEHGSLLLMLPPLQQHWRHALPKTKAPVAERINITFRQVFAGTTDSTDG